MSKRSLLPIILVVLTFYACGPDRKRHDSESLNEKITFQKSQRPLNPQVIVVPDGYKIEVAAEGLSYPVDVTFGGDSAIYIAEAGGHTYGTKPARATEARILRLLPDGTAEIIYDKVVPMNDIKKHDSSDGMEEGLIPPVTGLTWYNGLLYVSHRSRYSTLNPETGEFKTIINGLPSWGEFLNAKPVFHDNKMYFFLSTQGNTGVLEKHWVEVVNEFNKPNTHEIPGEDVTLTGKNFWVPTHKMTIVDADSMYTGVYVPLGETTKAGQVIKGEKICNGAFFKCDPDGNNIERIAWGFRSSFGYRHSSDGRLITTMNSANPMPPRGMYFDYETVYEVVQDEWYGWPDYYSGMPVTDPALGMKPSEQGFVLTDETHQKLLKGKALPLQPLVKLPVHSAAQGMVFGKGNMGVTSSDILVAEFGTIVPEFKGQEYHKHLPPEMPQEENAPHDAKYNWPGFKVQQVNITTGEVTDFIYNESNMPSSVNNTGGLERPLQLEWSNDGESLYIVDFGVVTIDDVGMNAQPFTGVLWKVSKK